MIEIGLMLMGSGMAGVFIVLSLLAFVMWVMGKVFGQNGAKTVVESAESTLSEKELLAIAAAIFQHEAVHVPEIKGPENWKKLARAGWYE